MMSRLLLLLSILLPGMLLGQRTTDPIVLHDSLRELFPWRRGQVAFLEDPSHQLTLAQVRSGAGDHRFINSREHPANFGFSTSTFWLRLRVRNAATRPLHWVIVCFYPLLDSVDCYQVNEQTNWVTTKLGGRLRSPRQRDIDAHSHAFPLEVAPGQRLTVYLRVAGNGAKVFNMVVEDTHAFYRVYQLETWIWGLSLGFLVGIILLQLTFFAVTRSRSFLLYTLYLIAFLGVEITRGNGLVGDRYLWPELPWLKQHGLVLATLLSILFGLLFYANGLRLRTYAPGWNRTLLAGGAFALLLTGAYLIAPGSQNIILLTVGLGVGANFLIVFACLISLRRGYLPARFYLLATASLLAGLGATVLWLLGILPKNFITNNAINLGSAIEQIFFALALADDYRRTRYQREQSQEELIRFLQVKNAEISAASLQGQTLERRRVAADLHDSLGGLLASLRWQMQQVDEHGLDEKQRGIFQTTLQTLTDAYQRVRLISHNLLPTDFEKQGLTQGLQHLVRTLSGAGNLQIDLEITGLDERLPRQTEFELYSISLELLTNVLKHTEATEAYLDLERQNGTLSLTVSDNGQGWNGQTSEGRGWQNIQDRVASLQGTVVVRPRAGRGTEVAIRVPV